jgi:hypothetical protein
MYSYITHSFNLKTNINNKHPTVWYEGFQWVHGDDVS